MKKKDNYLVIGNKGFIGSRLVKYLKKKNYKVYNSKSSFNCNENTNVIYCIGSDDWLKKPLKTYESNFIHLFNVIKKINNFKSFIFLSSTRLYLDNPKKKVKEKDNLIIKSNKRYIFNIQKLLSESLLMNSIKNSNIKIIRLSNIYSYELHQKTFLSTIIKNSIIKKKIEISLNINSSKDYISIDDAIRNIYLLSKKNVSGIFNLGSGKNITVKKIIGKIKEITGCEVLISNQNNFENYPLLNLSKIKKIINFKIKNSLLNDLRKIIINEKN